MKAFRIVMICGLGWLPAMAQEEMVVDETAVVPPAEEEKLELAPWDEEELTALKSGDLVPGSSLMGPIAREWLFSDNDEPIELDPSVRDLSTDDDEGVNPWAKSINPRFFTAYFRDRPAGYLNDPQELLTTQEFKEREGLLEYHGHEHEIDFYLYLFDAHQKLPDDESLQRLVDEHFEGGGPVAVVFYFLGMPGRAQIEFSKFVRDSVTDDEREKVLKMAINEAMEKSDPNSQLETFSIQASIRLYWLEKVVARNRSGKGLNGFLVPGLEVIEKNEPGIFERLQSQPVLLYSLLGILGGLWVTLIGFLARYCLERKRVYVFPDAQGSALLGAAHAAGVGGVISYASVSLPPSSQRSEVPSYLQKK